MSTNGKRLAFVVNALTGKELTAGNADTSRIHAVLMRPDFGCCSPESPPPIHDCPTPEKYREQLNTLVENWDPSNQLVLYFSGHGEIRNGHYCMQFGDERRRMLPFDDILTLLKIENVTKAVIILDTCRSGGAVGKKGTDDSSAIHLPTSEELPQGIAILASSRKGQFSHELEDGTGSVFTRLVCEAIETGLGGQATSDGKIGVSDLISFVRAQLKLGKYAKYSQDPVYEVNQADRTIWVAKNSSRPASPPSDPVESRRKIVHSVEELCRVAELLVPSRRPCFGATLDELDWDLVGQYARADKVDPSSRSRSELAAAIGLFVPLASSVSETLHNAAVLCFCRKPEKYISQARSTFLAGDIGGRQFVNQMVTGPLTRQLEQLVQLTIDHLRSGVSSFGDGALRRDDAEIPETVIRELLSNALAHRDYTATGNVQVHVTRHFVEVRNPGVFPATMSWDAFIQYKERNSCPPDPVVTLYTTLLRGSEGVGRGFIVFRDFIARNGTESMTCEVLPGPTTCVRIARPNMTATESGSGSLTRILFLSSNPAETARLRLDEEFQEVKKALRVSALRDKVQLVAEGAITLNGLLEMLNEYRPAVVHFSGHGSTDGIVLQDRNGRAVLLNWQAFTDLLKTVKDTVRLVFLNTCCSGPDAAAIAEVIDYAITLHVKTSDEDSITFAAAFYRALGSGRSVQDAFQQSRSAMILRGKSEGELPILYVRTGVDPQAGFLAPSAFGVNYDRHELLSRLKAVPDARLAELIVDFQHDQLIAQSASPKEQAIELIRAVEAQGPDACKRLAALLQTEASTGSHLDFDLRSGRGRTVKIAGSQLEKHAPRVLFGREAELAALDAAWGKGTLNVYTLVAWGGAGKTSLVFHWVQTRFAAKGWPGVERYFDWSFYSQGTGESRQTSADLFIATALKFFGDPDPTVGGPHERGERLAGLIRRYRTLLILDGIEPLQYPPNDPQAGRLKDPALESLLRELSVDNPGLVVITTREHLRNVEGLTTTEEQKLDRLSQEAAVSLLRHLQIVGTDEELQAAWHESNGHALTLSLLGHFIADAYEDRDIRHYREVKIALANQEHQGRSAFNVMIAYERWLQSGGPERQRELAVLRLTGLFDRQMPKSCLQALRAEPSIPGLTDSLVNLTAQQWNIAVKRLVEMELLSVSPDAIDAHPLVREYFAAQLKRNHSEAFREAHSRLFDYLCDNTPYRPDGLDGLAPLYKAITHGCLAGRHQEACDGVYFDRILRGTGDDGYYSLRKLGAVGANLAAVAAFFDEPWSRVSPNLTASDQAWLLSEAAFSLRALGRLTEALQPMRAGLEMQVLTADWKNAKRYSSNLSELELTLGRLPDAVSDARQSITHADQSGDTFQRMINRAAAADALHQSGQRADAGALFAEAERMQKEMQPEFNLLDSVQGFRYCDWLLAPAEQAAWRRLLNQPTSNIKSQISDDLTEIERRVRTTLAWATQQNSLLGIALDNLTLARVELIRAILAYPCPQPKLDLPYVVAATNGLRAAGQMNFLPLGLLTASLYHFVRGEPAIVQKHLSEAQQIAERGPMPLFLADIHLLRARLFQDRASLNQAATLIRLLGYGRRYEELQDAEEALDGESPRG